MKKPVILETQNGDYKFLLKFSTLVTIRDEYGIDLLLGTTKLAEDFSNLRHVFKEGVKCGEKRDFTEEEITDMFDDVASDIGIGPFMDAIVEAMALKMVEGVEESEDESTEKN